MKITVRVIPRAGKNLIRQEDGVWKVYLSKPAQGGQANQQLVALLAKHFGTAKSAITIIHGEKSRHKLIEVDE